MANVHPTAIIAPEAEVAQGAHVGPYCVISGRVKLAHGVRLMEHVSISGPAEIGQGTTIYPFATIGHPPQDLKFGPDSITAGVRIGRDCQIREHVSVHAATGNEHPTTLGDRVFMMATSHIGHDATVGNDAILVNGALVGGHAKLGDGVNMAGASTVAQHTRVGRLAFISGNSGTSTDVPPFCVLIYRNQLEGINLVGMRRAGIPREHITRTRQAFRDVLRKPLQKAEMLERLAELAEDCPPVQEIHDFIAEAKRPISAGMVRPADDLVRYLRTHRQGEGPGLSTDTLEDPRKEDR